MPQIKFNGPFIGIQKNLDSSFFSKRDAEAALNINLHLGTLKKRPGWEFYADVSDGGSALGLYEYVKLDGTTIQLAKAGATLQKIVTGVVTELGTGLNATELAKFATVNDKAYLCDSTTFKVTDGTTVYDAAITRPASAPTVATTGAVASGVLRGDYDYKYTFYSSTWGQESPASDVSTLVSPNGQNVTVTTGTTPPDARVDKKRFYRRKVSSAESLWTFYREVSIGTSADDDNVRDNDVDPTLIAPLSYSLTLPAFRYMAYQAGTLFLAGDSNDLYFTRANHPWEVDSAITIGSSGDSDPITGLWSFQGVTIVFKRHSIWSVSGNSKETIYSRRISSGVGCSSGHSIVEVDGMLYFLGERSFYSFDGASDPVAIGDRAKPDLVTRNFARDRYVVSVHDHVNQAILWSYSASGGANDSIYVYFIENSRRSGERSWCPWTFNPQTVTSFGIFSDPATKVREVYLGFDEGGIVKLSGPDDNGTGITHYWRTGKFDLGVADRVKRWGELTCEVSRQAVASTLDVKYYLDDGAAITLVSHDQSEPIIRRRVKSSSKDLRLEFYGNHDQPTEIIGWTIFADLAGRV